MSNICPTCGRTVAPAHKRRVSVMAKNVKHGDVVFIDDQFFTVTQWSMKGNFVLFGGENTRTHTRFCDERVTVERAQ